MNGSSTQPWRSLRWTKPHRVNRIAVAGVNPLGPDRARPARNFAAQVVGQEASPPSSHSPERSKLSGGSANAPSVSPIALPKT